MVLKYPCTSCCKPVKNNQRGIQCTQCSSWVHARCAGIDSKDYDNPSIQFVNWKCSKCMLSFLPGNAFEEETLNSCETSTKSLENQENDSDMFCRSYTSTDHTKLEFKDETMGTNVPNEPIVRAVNGNK